MEPLIVTAHLPGGYCPSDPWSPALDGILAYWQLRERLGEEEFALGGTGHRPLVVSDELPLAKEVFGEHWWYQVSAPMHAENPEQFERFVHRRFDDHYAYRYAPEGTKRVEISAGPFKAYRNQRRVVLVDRVWWHAIGDADEVRRLLQRCGYIGQGIARGWGEVVEWTVVAGGDAHLARFARPLPYAFAETHGLKGAPMDWGLVPPGRDPRNRTLCVMPL